jgi:hypothetical protein
MLIANAAIAQRSVVMPHLVADIVAKFLAVIAQCQISERVRRAKTAMRRII